jgi:ubiquitin-like modifier-activating enzyme ATG7
VALGFDNFIVIRHGGCPIDYDPKKMGIRPGCYFCNDYLSPSNTMKDRSLDMQCTVTRPGLSYISTAYASELLVNMLHLFPEDYSRETRDSLLNSDEFGLVPQHVRGSASGFNVELMTSESYDQ